MEAGAAALDQALPHLVEIIDLALAQAMVSVLVTMIGRVRALEMGSVLTTTTTMIGPVLDQTAAQAQWSLILAPATP